MNIQIHIKELLFRHDCVIVSGLGGFVCKSESAKIVDGYVFPPSKKISFNQNLISGDGLLENYVAKKEKVSYQIAQQNILSFSEKIKNSLHEDGSVVLSGLGTFKKNDNENLVFNPDSDQEWLTEAFGLPKFKIKPLQTEEQPEETVIPLKDQNKDLTEDPSKPKTYYWKYAAVGLIAIGISGVFGTQLYKNSIKSHNQAALVEANKIVEEKIQQSSFMFSEPLSPLSVEVTEKKEELGKYHIVGGAFRIKANAEKKIKQLKAKGFKARYIGENRYGLHQVVYSSFNDRLEAIKELKNIKANENSSAWLFVKEL